MFSRKTPPSRSQRPPPTRRPRGRKSSSPNRTQSVSGFAVTVARSSRSTATSVSGGQASVQDEVVLPLTLFEYGFPARQTAPLTTTDVFTDPAGVAFMNSPGGAQLRSLERQYNRTVSQYVRRSVRLAGKRVLVLGSGSSKSTASLLSRGVMSATFVDVSAPALNRLRANIEEMGLDATVDIEYVCDDAWAFLSSLDGEEYDLVMALKCVGLVLAHAPGRTTSGLLNLVSDALNPDGSFITDHHEAFSTPEWDGKRIGTGMDDTTYALATIGGRYSDDVGYSWDVVHPDLECVLRFSSPSAPHGVQTWHTFHFRARHPGDQPTLGAELSAAVQQAPTPLPTPPLSDFDAVADAMIPVNNRGVKRVPTPGDISSFDVTRAKPKFDGRPGVMVMDGPNAVFVSPVSTFAIPLCAGVAPRMVVAAELVDANEGGSVVVVTGVINVGGMAADPNDSETLQSVARPLAALGPSGVMLNLPSLMRSIRGNAVVLTGPSGRAVTLPVDGVNLSVAGSSGVFAKPAALHTIDARPSEVVDMLAFSNVALRLPLPHTAAPSTRSGVWEYAFNPRTATWYPVRPRPDKTVSDTPGAVIHTVVAAMASADLGLRGTVEEIARNLTR